MPLLHIEHIEDTVLKGDLSALELLESGSNLSAKIDGSPSIVWGQDPADNLFFVGTKSVFNKKLVKRCKSYGDIDNWYEGDLHEILTTCFRNLPNDGNIYQGDFIGFGGYRDYKPNAISYTLDEVTQGAVVVAPHTAYAGEVLKHMIPYPLREKLTSDGVTFIQPNAWLSQFGSAMDIKTMVGFAKQMATLCEFVTEKEARQLKQDLNAYIKDGEEVIAEEFVNYQLVRLWCLVENIKTEYMKLMRDNFKCECYLGGDYVDGEGYVMTGKHGTYKLVNRWVFSHYNFNIIRS